MPVPRTFTIGHLIGGSFGLVFILVNGGLLPAAVQWAVGIAAVAAFGFVLVAFVVRVGRGAAERPEGGFTGRYWLIVGAEAVLLFGGLALVRAVEPAAALGWIALIVGLHFIPMAWLWAAGRSEFLTIGIVMAALGVVGLALAFVTGNAPLVALIAGVGSGAVLLGSAVLAAVLALSRERGGAA
jgi:hypothetical protein